MGIEDAFGQVVRRMRKERHLSQETLAFNSHLDRSFISLLECGRKQPTLITIFQIARALNVSPSEIIKAVEELEG
ncbi:helix-turn-helix domain-containing protein [Geobacter grbiciae]|uniref:helix-turn-helix domain-containing protein n=1 Tax=Geobacter grbiciae TaxID=155042 RepID=UPI001C0395E4|nr:helix-turn-helix transcriptional regulator [Geobacter grbiciae]MBT1074412.1 helix-turn-helix domain-containing protein [Geobacter grbiciae]